MAEVIEFVQNNGLAMVNAALGLIGFFAFVARFTDNKNDDRFIQLILDAINFAGMNNGKASNK